MKDRIKKSLLPIAGSNLKVSNNPKSLKKKEKDKFIRLVDSLKNLNTRANTLQDDFGINLFYYEDIHYQLLEDLLEEVYGGAVSKVIFWWVYDAEDPKNNDYKIRDEKTEAEYTVRSTKQLYNIIKKLDIFK